MTLPRLIALLCAFLPVVTGCAGLNRNSVMGWDGDDVYRVAISIPAIVGEPPADGGTTVFRRRETLQKAVETAREKILHDLVASRVDRDAMPGSRQRAWLQLTLDRELRGALSRGVIEYRKFHKNNTCQIVYRIELKGLRERASGHGAALGKNKKEAR